MFDLSTKTALITGASSGLGAEFAQQLAIEKFDLVLTARREDRLNSLAGSLRSQHGVNVTVVPADLSVSTDLERLTDIAAHTPELDLLVNNAGFGIHRRFIKADPDIELSLLQVHMIAPVALCRAVLPAMVSRNHGAIINVSSMAGIVPIRSVLYGSSKSFLINFSEALQYELRGTGVKIQALCPGYTFTEFHDTPEYVRFNRKSIPGFLWLSSEYVVNTSLRELNDNHVICIPGRIYSLLGMLARNSLTAGIVATAARYVIRKRNH